MTMKMTEQKAPGCWFRTTGTRRALSKGCAKGLLITLNLFCILNALWTFCYAVVDIRILKQYGEERAAGSRSGDMVIVSVCILLTFTAVLGCVGAVSEKLRVLYVYVVCILGMIVVELVVAVFVSVGRYGLQYRVSEWLQEQFYSNATRTDDELREHLRFWNALQAEYECCGVNGPEDYTATGRSISLSCCSKAYRAKTSTAQRIMYATCIESAAYHSAGCEDVLLQVLNEAPENFFVVIIITFWFESTGIFLAMWVAHHIKNSVQVYKTTVKY